MTLARGPTGGSVSAHFVRGFFLDLCTVKLNLPTDAVGGLEPLLEQQLSDSGSASTAQDATACPFLDGVPSDMKTRELIVADLVGLYAAHAEYDARVRHALRLVASALQVPVGYVTKRRMLQSSQLLRKLQVRQPQHITSVILRL